MPDAPVLRTQELSVAFGGHQAVNRVSCAFHRGSLTAIVGPNGAGKTTYLNLISGQLRATGGEVWLDGASLVGTSAARRAHMGIGRAFQLTSLFPNLTVLENVRLAVQSRRGGSLRLLSLAARRSDLTDLAQAYLKQVRLEQRAGDVAAALPHGDQRKLEVAILLALEPKVFLFDEPTAGMSVDEVPVVLDLIHEIKNQGDKTILLVEHKMSVVRALSDRIIVLHNGALVADGLPDEVIASPIVQQAYLGMEAPAVAENLLALEGVHTHIGRYHILQGVDLSVPEGAVTMLLGRNGVGKSTTLRTIMGFWRASQGNVRFENADITTRPTPDIARLGIAYVPEEMGIFGNLSVKENMILAARSGEPDDTRLKWIFGLFPALETFWLKTAGTLSGGQKQMLAIARAIIEPRRLIVVDEPSKGLAPAIVDHLADAFRELKAARTTLLMVEQNIGLAKAVGDSVAVMADGRVIHSGAMADLASDEALQTRLLGLSLESHQ